MKKFDAYIYLILVIKIAYIFLTVTHIYLKIKGRGDSAFDIEILYWQHRFEFIFVCLMSFLLIYLFNPMKPNVVIDSETKLLFFMFGFALLLTANWNVFVHEAKWFTYIQRSIGIE